MSVTPYQNGIRFVKSTYDKIYYHGQFYPHRFDTKQLFDIILHYNSYDEDGDAISFYTKINHHRFVLTLSFKTKNPTVTISMLDYITGVTAKTMPDVDTSKFPFEYPIFQYTENPVIVLMTCYVCRSIFYNDPTLYDGIGDLIEHIYKKLEKHKDYELK